MVGIVVDVDGSAYSLFPDVVRGVFARRRHGLVDGGVEVVHVEQGLRRPQPRP